MAVAPASQTASSTTTSLAGQSIYTSGEYGFSIRYPETADVEDTFAGYYHLAPYWAR